MIAKFTLLFLTCLSIDIIIHDIGSYTYAFLFEMYLISLIFYRLNKKPPNISLRRKEKGGINLTTTVSKIFFFLNYFLTLFTRHFILIDKIKKKQQTCQRKPFLLYHCLPTNMIWFFFGLFFKFSIIIHINKFVFPCLSLMSPL